MPERSGEAGSTLLLVPSAVLVLFLLTGLVVDSAASFLAQRELADACAGAANDTATAALDPARLYGTGGSSTLVVGLDEAAALARSRAAPLVARWHQPIGVHADTSGPDVALRLDGEAPLPIGRGGHGRARIHVTATCRSTSIRR